MSTCQPHFLHPDQVELQIISSGSTVVDFIVVDLSSAQADTVVVEATVLTSDTETASEVLGVEVLEAQEPVKAPAPTAAPTSAPTSAPTATPTDDGDGDGGGDGGAPIGAIAGGAVGGMVALTLLAGIVWYCRRKSGGQADAATKADRRHTSTTAASSAA